MKKIYSPNQIIKTIYYEKETKLDEIIKKIFFKGVK